MIDQGVSVVVPVYDNAETVEELGARVLGVLGDRLEQLIFVNDGCPAGSELPLTRLERAHPAVTLLDLGINRGQQTAILAGLARAPGDWVVVMDADLQDPPEAIPLLLAAGAGGADAVFAGRRGRYESRLRLISGRGYRRLLAWLTRVPADAGGFVALRRPAVDRVLAMHRLTRQRPPALAAMVGLSGVRAVSVPVARERRARGRSAYSWNARWLAAKRALTWAISWRIAAPALGPIRTGAGDAGDAELRRHAFERHNEIQRGYFNVTKPTMVPRRSRYLERHLDELLAAAQIKPGDRILEVGCGMGRYTTRLAERELDVEGLDLAPFPLEKLEETARRAGLRIPLHKADVLDPPQQLLGRFDAVVGLFALHHMHDIPACLGSIARLLRPGGRVAFCEPNPFNPLYYAQIALRPGMTWEGDGGIVKIRRRRLATALAEAGFEDVYWRRFGFFPPGLTESPFGRLERPLERFPLWRAGLPFQLFGGRLPA